MVRVQSTLNIEFLPLTEPLLVANLVLKIFELQFSNSCRLGHGYRGYYIAENGEHRWYDLSRTIGNAFVRAGLATSDVPSGTHHLQLNRNWLFCNDSSHSSKSLRYSIR